MWSFDTDYGGCDDEVSFDSLVDDDCVESESGATPYLHTERMVSQRMLRR